jgi:hypothetical protein
MIMKMILKMTMTGKVVKGINFLLWYVLTGSNTCLQWTFDQVPPNINCYPLRNVCKFRRLNSDSHSI